jgi:hypothetical protein
MKFSQIISVSDIERCPRGSLSFGHYKDDGSCLCPPEPAGEDTAAAVRPLHVIAADIKAHWDNVYFGAVPYLKAMGYLDTMDSQFIDQDADEIVLYFLSNAKVWRGDDARRIKAELRAMLAGAK